MTRITEEERAIIDYVENQDPKSVSNLSAEMNRYKNMALQQMTKKKAISLRLLENDIELIKARALSHGIPYQTLLSSIVHQYATGKIRLEA